MLIVAVLALVAGCGAATSDNVGGQPSNSPSSASNDISDTFDIGGGRKLYLQCTGTGSPTILLEAGDESHVSDWGRVIPGIVNHTRTCAYDRAGNGRSDEATGCRDLDDLLGDLEALLKVAKVEGPYVLVGTSGGGYLMAGLAARRPADVAGLVLVETARAIINAPADLVASLKCDAPTNVERRDYVAVEHAAWDRRKRLGDFPMTIISNDFGPSAPPGDRTNVADQRGWLVLSPKSKQVVVTSGHDVPGNEPDVVIKAILAVLKAARGG